MRSKQLLVSDKANSQLSQFDLDTTVVKLFLKQGDIDFSQSDTKAKPCKIYVVENQHLKDQFQMRFSNCDSTLTLTQVNRN